MDPGWLDPAVQSEQPIEVLFGGLVRVEGDYVCQCLGIFALHEYPRRLQVSIGEVLLCLRVSKVPFIQHLPVSPGLAQESATASASSLVFFETVDDDIRAASPTP